jgi:hypothetical protein
MLDNHLSIKNEIEYIGKTTLEIEFHPDFLQRKPREFIMAETFLADLKDQVAVMVRKIHEYVDYNTKGYTKLKAQFLVRINKNLEDTFGEFSPIHKIYKSSEEILFKGDPFYKLFNSSVITRRMKCIEKKLSYFSNDESMKAYVILTVKEEVDAAIEEISQGLENYYSFIKNQQLALLSNLNFSISPLKGGRFELIINDLDKHDARILGVGEILEKSKNHVSDYIKDELDKINDNILEAKNLPINQSSLEKITNMRFDNFISEYSKYNSLIQECTNPKLHILKKILQKDEGFTFLFDKRKTLQSIKNALDHAIFNRIKIFYKDNPRNSLPKFAEAHYMRESVFNLIKNKNFSLKSKKYLQDDVSGKNIYLPFKLLPIYSKELAKKISTLGFSNYSRMYNDRVNGDIMFGDRKIIKKSSKKTLSTLNEDEQFVDILYIINQNIASEQKIVRRVGVSDSFDYVNFSTTIKDVPGLSENMILLSFEYSLFKKTTGFS